MEVFLLYVHIYRWLELQLPDCSQIMKSQIIFRLRPLWFNPSSKNNILKKNFPDLKRRIWAENEPLLEMPLKLPFNVVDKVFSSDQWNFDTKNVRYSTLRKKKFQIMKMIQLAIKAWYFFAFESVHPVPLVF